MSKNLLIVVILFILTQNVKAQKSDSVAVCKPYIYLTGGVGVPIGTFGHIRNNKYVDNENACFYANKGFVCDILSDVPVKNSIYTGIILLGYHTYTIDYQDRKGSSTMVYGMTTYDENGGESNWDLSMMPGIAIDVPKKHKRLNAEIDILLGVSECHYSYLSYKSVYQQTVPPYQVIVTSNYIPQINLISLAVEGGIGLNYFLNRRLAVKLNMDCFVTGGRIESVGHDSAISIFKFTAGIGYQLGE